MIRLIFNKIQISFYLKVYVIRYQKLFFNCLFESQHLVKFEQQLRYGWKAFYYNHKNYFCKCSLYISFNEYSLLGVASDKVHLVL